MELINQYHRQIRLNDEKALSQIKIVNKFKNNGRAR